MALDYVLIDGTPSRFRRGKQIGNYVGMIPSEDSSGGKQRVGHISKQGNSLLRAYSTFSNRVLIAPGRASNVPESSSLPSL
jgi:transposase